MSLGDGGLRCLDCHHGWQLITDKKTGDEWWQLLDSRTTRLDNVYVAGEGKRHKDLFMRFRGSMAKIAEDADDGEDDDSDDDDALLREFDDNRADTKGAAAEEAQAAAEAQVAVEAQAKAHAKAHAKNKQK